MEHLTPCPHCSLTPLVFEPSGASQIPSDILSTNRPLLDSEVELIRNVIAREQAQKARLYAQIVALRAALDRCVQEHNSVAGDIRMHEKTLALSPLRRMPPELLSLIFMATMLHSYDPAPWEISQVCRRWRNVVLNQPTFWTSINLCVHRDRGRVPVKYRLEVQLQRSALLPLEVFLMCRSCEAWDDEELDIVQVLASHSARWRTLQTRGHWSMHTALAPVIRGRIPILKKLYILADTSKFSNDDELQSLDAFQFAPQLQQVSINIDGNAISANLPFAQLFQYAAHNTWQGHINSLRSASHNLVECALKFEEPGTPPTTRIVLPNLIRLSVSDSDFLECLEVPKLQELYCYNTSNHLSSVLARRPHLQKLGILSTALVTDVAGILRAIPSITEIVLFVSKELNEEFISLFTLRNATTDVGLALRSIHILSIDKEIDFLDYTTFCSDADDLVAMVESRWRGGQLSVLTLPTRERWVHRNKCIEECVKHGLKLNYVLFAENLLRRTIPPSLLFKMSDSEW